MELNVRLRLLQPDLLKTSKANKATLGKKVMGRLINPSCHVLAMREYKN